MNAPSTYTKLFWHVLC